MDARNNHAKLAIVTAGDVDARIPVVVVDEVSLPVFAILECLVDWVASTWPSVKDMLNALL